MDWAREARGPGPRGPGPRAQRASRAQSIAELYIFLKLFVFFLCMKMVDEDGWILEFKAENDTK